MSKKQAQDAPKAPETLAHSGLYSNEFLQSAEKPHRSSSVKAPSSADAETIETSPPQRASRTKLAYTPVASKSRSKPIQDNSHLTLNLTSGLRASPEARALLHEVQASLALRSHPSDPERPSLASASDYADKAQGHPSPRISRDQDDHEMPLHTSAAAQLQHIIASAVHATSTPVNQLQHPASTDKQLAHWRQLQFDLTSRLNTLSPAEQLHLHLIKELQDLHQQALEDRRHLDIIQRQHAADLIALRDSLGASASRPLTTGDASEPLTLTRQTSASQPILILSQSPHNSGQLQRDMQPTIHRTTSTTLLPQGPLNPAMPQNAKSPQPARARTDSRHAQANKVTWLTAVQDISRTASQLKLQAQKQEQALYDTQQRLLAADAQDQAVIQAASLRIQQRQALVQSSQIVHDPSQPSDITAQPQPGLKIRVRKPAKISRDEEKRLAVLTNDKDLLRHGSHKLHSESCSSDDDNEIKAELKPSTAASLIFNPLTSRQLRSMRDRNGFIQNDFVRSDNEEEEQPSSQSVDNQEDDDDLDDNDDAEYEDDGDPSSDYAPSSPEEPPPGRPKRFSEAQWREYQTLLRAKHQKQVQSSQQPAQPQLQQTPRYNISIADPPEHGEWRDIHHLMTIFKDKHAKYVKRCGDGHSLSVWECYTETAQQCIIKQLQQHNSSSPQQIEAHLVALSNEDLYALLQNELGISYDMEVEQALTAITFTGSILDKPNWVAFHTSWSQVLKRVTKAGTLQPRRMAELFRERIPDDFMQSWLKARKHPSWETAYDAAVTALLDPKWQTCYAKHIIAKQKEPTKQPAKPLAVPTQSSLPHLQHPGPPTLQPPTPQAPQVQQGQKQYVQQKLEFPVSANKNVNPNFVPGLSDNPTKAPCERCGANPGHRWNSDLCTADRSMAKGKQMTPLTATEFATRLQQRWDKGYAFSKPINSFKSPTVEATASAAAAAQTKLSVK
jgi:hypothetical protein